MDPELQAAYDALFEWGWTVEFMGWRRCLWLGVQIDFRHGVSVILFGVLVAYHRRLKPLDPLTAVYH